MRCAALPLTLLVGCRQFLGLDEPTRAADSAVDDLADVSPDLTADSSLCRGSFTTVCLDALPQGTVNIGTSVTIDTDTSSACVPTTNGVDACVIAGRSITIAAGVTVSGVGTKPLILVATEGPITIGTGATLDVSSHRLNAKTGAGFGRGSCSQGAPPGPSGGGPGGSFGQKGGNGGGAGGNGGAQSGSVMPLGTTLRGGCAGGNGGSGGTPGIGGNGGGAVELIAIAIDVEGTINASGAGGTAGGDGGNAPGGGGGSGGAIVLAAPSVTVSGSVFANGGGGGGGENGSAGGDPVPPAAGAGGNGGIGGDGGDGSLGGVGADGESSGNGGGGGGGGAGITYTADPTPPTSGVSPPFS